MRSKTRVVRPRLCVSPIKPSPTSTSVRPIPTPNPDDVNEEYDVAVDSGDDVTVGERTYRHLDCSNSDVNWLDGEACIQCNKRGEELLVCSEIGCPVAFHERCLRLEPKFDDAGKFYCPYCWYKREVAKTRELWEKAMLAKKALSLFIDLRMENVKEDYGRTVDDVNRKRLSGRTRYNNYSNTVDVDGDIEKGLVQDEGDCDYDGNGRKLAESLQGRVVLECHTGPSPAAVNGRERISGIESLTDSISKEKVNGNLMSKSSDIQIMENVQMQEQDDELFDDPDETLEDEEGAELLNAQAMEEQNVNVPCDENQGMPVDQVLLEEPETTVLSTKGEVAPKEPEMPDSAVETITLCQRRHVKRSGKNKTTPHLDSESPGKSSSPHPRASKQRAGHQRKVNPSKTSAQPKKSFKECMYTNFAMNFVADRRKRVLWSAEEEEMLKKGVEKYSNTTNKNIPWRKIFEYGHHVFDSTRTPDDLRSKWKNSMANSKSRVGNRG